MTLGRLLIVGGLVMAAVYLLAAAIASLVPYAFGAFILWVVGAAIHKWLSDKDDDTANKAP